MGMFETQIASIYANIVFSHNCRDVKNEGFRKENCISCFYLLCCWKRNRKRKNKMEKGPKNLITLVFLRWCMKKGGKRKKWIFSRNRPTLFARKGEERAFSCTPSVLAKHLFWPKTDTTRKNYKIVVSAETA